MRQSWWEPWDVSLTINNEHAANCVYQIGREKKLVCVGRLLAKILI